jgi:hypothetical protein
MFPRAFLGVLALALMMTVTLASPAGAVTKSFDVSFTTTFPSDFVFGGVSGEFVAQFDPSQSLLSSTAQIKSLSALPSPNGTGLFDYTEEPIPGSKTNATRFVLTLKVSFAFDGLFTLRTFGYNDAPIIINCLGANASYTSTFGNHFSFNATSAISNLVSVHDVVGAPPPVLPPATNWVGNSGNWTTAGNWDNGVPQASFAANLITTTTNKTATYNQTVDPGVLSAVTVDGTGGSTFTINQSSAATSLTAVDETIGRDGKGVYNQSGGSNTIFNALTLGYNAGSSGTYNKSGGTLDTGFLIVGREGTGTFNQNSGSNTVSFELRLGDLSGSKGTYNLNSGSLSAFDETIGSIGKGTFNHNSGTNTVGDTLVLDNGTYNLNSGSLSAPMEIIGQFDTSTFNHNSGTNKVSSFLSLGNGTYNLNSGNLSAPDENIGDLGTGTFNHKSGSNTVSNVLTLGVAPGDVGTYNLKSGTLQAANEIIGNAGTGIFNQTGGINTVTNTLTLAANSGSSGTYNFKGGILSAPTIQINAGGIFNITGISPTLTSDVTNAGTVKTTNANATWNGTFTNSGAYISDPSRQTFNKDLVVTSTGYLVGLTSQDLFIFKNDFQNQTQDTTHWNTVSAGMKFITGADTTHNLYVPGVDQGRFPASSLYAWYSLDITGQTIDLQDGNTGNASTGLYVGKMLGAIINGSNKVTNIIGGPDAAHPILIYFDPNLNPTLGKNDYAFATGFGALMWDPNNFFSSRVGTHMLFTDGDVSTNAVPLPPSVFLLGSGLLGLRFLGWRKRRG